MNPKTKLILALLITLSLLPACKRGAEGFFSGRPSDMAMVHGRIITGGEPEMLDLLKVPARFPEATDRHKADWQNSVVAWWSVPSTNHFQSPPVLCYPVKLNSISFLPLLR